MTKSHVLTHDHPSVQAGEMGKVKIRVCVRAAGTLTSITTSARQAIQG